MSIITVRTGNNDVITGELIRNNDVIMMQRYHVVCNNKAIITVITGNNDVIMA